jgi:peptide/nickel transport system substrate-binding protein
MSKLGLVALTILLLSQALPPMLSEAWAEPAIDLTGTWTGYFTLEFQMGAGIGKGTVNLLIYKHSDDQIEGLISYKVDFLDPESPEVLRWLSSYLSGPVSGKVIEKLVPGGTITQVDMVIGWGGLPVSGTYDNQTMELNYQERDLKLRIILTREEIIIPAPGPEVGAEFKVSNLMIKPTEVIAGEAVEVSVTVTNVGKQSGEYKVTLGINGVVEDVKTVSLAAGESKVVTFIVEKDVAGTYEVAVNGLTGSFRVESYFDFSISVSPTSSTVVRGESAIYTITVSLVSGSGVPVTLYAPKGNGLRFALNPDKGIPPFTSTLTVYTSNATDAGRWSFKIVAVGGGVRHETDNIYLTVEPTQVSKCIIATAAYGSELNPLVQFLRGFRENVVLKTFAGSQFMNIFNAWYYSFSPSVAAYISSQDSLKAVVRGILYPLLGILHLGVIVNNTLSFNSELGIVVTGLVVSALIGFVYFTPLTLIPLYAAKKWRKNQLELRPKILLPLWITSLMTILLGEAILSPTLMMIGTGLLVLLTITLASLATSISALKAAYKISHRE